MTDIFEPVQNLEYDPAPMSELIRTRSYARRVEGEERLETWDETVDRCLYSSHLGLKFLGKFTEEETRLVDQMMRERKAFGSARWLWVGGSKWVEKPENYPGGFNCSAWEIVDWDSFGIMMDLAMQGCGTGANVELRCIEQLPVINTKLEVKIVGEPGQREAHKRSEETLVWFLKGSAWILVGDSRQGWVNAYQKLLELSASDKDELKVFVDVSGVRPAGERLLGFGGIANPIALPGMFLKCADVLNQAVGRKLNSLEVCLLIGEAAAAVVAGNVRRCLPEDALVHTANGLVPIKAVNVGDLVQTPAGFKRVTNKFYQGLQDVYEIRTNSMPFRSTLSHRHAVLASAKGDFRWVSCNDLIEGDRLLHTKDVLPGTKTDLPPDFTQLRPKNSTTAKNLTIPSLTPLIAWLIGFTHGNGHVGLGRNKYGKPYGYVNWTTNATYSEEFLTRLKEKIKNGIAEFGLDIEVTPIKGENTIRFNCCSIRLAEYFHKFIKQAGRSLEVPDFILKGDASIRSAYLAGLVDSDGAIYNRPPVLVTNISKTFIYQVGSVLSSLGIAGRYAMSLPSNPNWNIRHSVNIPALKPLYNSLIAPYSLKGPIKIGLKMYGYTIPATLMREEYTYTQMRGMKLSASRQHDSNYEKYSQESDVEIDIPVTVESVEFFETMETYDIEVEEVNCFYCNGYLTHNSAGLRVGSSDDPDFTTSKDNLWQQDESGNWVIDHKRDALRSANHTRAFHKKPTYEECLEAVTKQYHSGEGAIQWSGEAVARANADLLNSPEKKALFLSLYQESIEAAKAYLKSLSNGSDLDEKVLENRIRRYSANPCHEIIGSDFMCNLAEVHLNQLDPYNFQEQKDAFRASSLQASALLQRDFAHPRINYARTIDPIVGVSATGFFTFFTKLFGVDYVRWWEAGRNPNWDDLSLDGDSLLVRASKLIGFDYDCAGKLYKRIEAEYCKRWRDVVERTVYEYCDRHGLRRPNRCTTVKPSGSMSMLTGTDCNGLHPPFAAYFIRRMTFGKNDPVALAAIDYGYNVVPSQSDKDETGKLLNDPFDDRCTEWLVEVPVKNQIVNAFPELENIKFREFSALAHFDFYMVVQQNYIGHTGSVTISLSEDEIKPLAKRIYEAIRDDEGYVGMALLAKFDAPFPRLPYEAIFREKYNELMKGVSQRRKSSDFNKLLSKHLKNKTESGPQDSACEGLICESRK